MAALIDWHAHHTPPELLEKLEELGGRRLRPYDEDVPDFAVRLKEMDAAGVELQLVCQTRVDPEVWPPEQALALVRAANDALAERVSQAPERFLGVICITLKDVQGSVEELERMAARGFRAVLMYPRCEGEVVMDRPEMEPIFAKIAQLDLPIFLHGGGGTKPDPSLELLEDGGAGVASSVLNEASICEWAVRGVASGLFDRHQNLRVVIRSGGGLMPLLLNRLTWPHKEPAGVKRYHEVVREHFAVDTRASDARTLRFVIDAMGEDCLVFGSDYAGGTGPLRGSLTAIEAQPNPEWVKTITERNARRLLRL